MEASEATVVGVEDTGWVRGDGQAVKIRLSIRTDGGFESTKAHWVAPHHVPDEGDRIVIHHDGDEWSWENAAKRRESDPLMKIMKQAIETGNAITETPEQVYDIAQLHPAETKDHRLAKLKDLKERGLISEAEYTTHRDQIRDEL